MKEYPYASHEDTPRHMALVGPNVWLTLAAKHKKWVWLACKDNLHYPWPVSLSLPGLQEDMRRLRAGKKLTYLKIVPAEDKQGFVVLTRLYGFTALHEVTFRVHLKTFEETLDHCQKLIDDAGTTRDVHFKPRST